MSEELNHILKNCVHMYGPCPGCLTIHCDTVQVARYLQWLASEHMFVIDHYQAGGKIRKQEKPSE